jgi:hypothetical protein
MILYYNIVDATMRKRLGSVCTGDLQAADEYCFVWYCICCGCRNGIEKRAAYVDDSRRSVPLLMMMQESSLQRRYNIIYTQYFLFLFSLETIIDDGWTFVASRSCHWDVIEVLSKWKLHLGHLGVSILVAVIVRHAALRFVSSGAKLQDM